MKHMTPDEARDLAGSFEGRRLAADYETYGLADGYQHIEHYVLLEIDGEHPETGEPDVWADTLGMPDKATADMIAAAPTLAATIAGMREEWVGQYIDRDGKWDTICTYPTREEVARHLDYLCWDAYTHTRIVRRYVTNEEEA